MGYRQFRTNMRDAVVGALWPVFRHAIQSAPQTTGKLLPLADHGRTVIYSRGEKEEIPPPGMWVGYADYAEEYLDGGREDMEAVMALLARLGIEQPRVALDLGCAAGRMVKHFPRHENSEIWGADINASQIEWCRNNLPDLNFFTTSTAPHLPFADGYFDFVYCASVFTHITDLSDAWLLEIRRVLRTGGHAYITVHDMQTYRELLTTYLHTGPPDFIDLVVKFERQHRLADAPPDMFYFGSDPNSQVFLDRDYIVGRWSKWMRLVTYEPQSHGYQSAMVWQKT